MVMREAVVRQGLGGGKRCLKVKARTDGPTDVTNSSRSFASAGVGRSPTGIHHIASACPPTTADGVANGRLALYPGVGHVGVMRIKQLPGDVLDFLDH